MDLESECSAFESFQGNELTTCRVDQTSSDGVDTGGVSDNKVKSNCSCSDEIHGTTTSGNVDANSSHQDGSVNEGVGVVRAENYVNSPPLAGKSPLTKGYGLRKWRRIKRDVVKDSGANVDNNKAMKRRESTVLENQTKPINSAVAETNQNTEGSVASVNLLENQTKPINSAVAETKQNTEGSVASVSLLENQTKPINSAVAETKQNTEGSVASVNMLRNASIGSVFAAGIDSDNSEDRGSKSSTAASAPSAVLGYVHERNRMKNLSGMGTSSSTQPVKGRVEVTKKHRGDRIKIEKENSLSSIESDSRSSNLVFALGANHVMSNGKQSGKSMNHEYENGVEVHDYARQKNVADLEDGSQDDLAADGSWEGKEGNGENHHQSAGGDPLLEAVLSLQSVQEALESEIKKMGEVGKLHEDESGCATFADPEFLESGSSVLLSGQTFKNSNFLEIQLSNVTNSVKCLEIRLEEAGNTLKQKESRIAELEAHSNTVGSSKVKSRESATELESHYQRKIEAEIEYLMLTRTLQRFRVEDGAAATSGSEKVQPMNKLIKRECKAASSLTKATDLHVISEIEEVLKTQGKVCKTTVCLVIQVSLLMLVILLYVSQLSSHNDVAVPT